MNAQANRIPAQLGFWAAVLSALAFLLYTVAFVAILRAGPPLVWTNLQEYVAAIRQTNQFWKHLAQFSMLLFAPLFLVLLHSIHELAPRPKQPLSRIAISFGLGFAILFSLHYFVQLTTVRLAIAGGAAAGAATGAGLEQFIQLRPHAAITAVNMLGTSLFLGLASLFIAPVFGRNRLERAIRLAFLALGVICLASGAAFLLDNAALIFFLTTFALGGVLLVLFVTLALYFRLAFSQKKE